MIRFLLAMLVALSLCACAGTSPSRPGIDTVAAPGAGARVSGRSGLYSLALPGPEWRVENPPSDDTAPDLFISGPERGSFVLVHTIPDATTTMDDVVDQRRHAVHQKLGAEGANEKRYFLDARSYVPVSMARYGAGGAKAGSGVVVLTVRAAALIEVVGVTSAWESYGAALDAMLRSFALEEHDGGRSE